MESEETGFGGRVVREVGGAEFGEHGGDCDDVATDGGGEEGREEGVHGVEGGVEVGVQGGCEVGGGKAEEGLSLGGTGGIIYEDCGGKVELRCDG